MKWYQIPMLLGCLVCSCPASPAAVTPQTMQLSLEPKAAGKPMVLLGQNYYTDETEARLLVAGAGLAGGSFRLADETATLLKTALASDYQLLPLPIEKLPEGRRLFQWQLQLPGGRETLQGALAFEKLPPKPHTVKINRISRGLIVDGKPFFPGGFYTYSEACAVTSGQVADAAFGLFNVVSPYQTITPDTLDNRLKFLDECAGHGLKVHYQLQSVVDDTAVKPDDPEYRRKMAQLEAEVLAVREHEALLAWYISDEPTGHGATPEGLQAVYETIRRLDPYHPISVVFMSPSAAVKFADGFDLSMADHYPVPWGPPLGPVAEYTWWGLRPGKPCWTVPQAFGGAEWWEREPTAQEMRGMVYSAVAAGTTGIQYFIRRWPNGFPKSRVLWGECINLNLELQELAPFLLSEEDYVPVAVAGEAGDRSGIEKMSEAKFVVASGWRRAGSLLVIAVNYENRPKPIELSLPGCGWNGEAEVKFETGRRVAVENGRWRDFIDGYGVRIYQLELAPQRFDRVKIDPANLTADPSFEANTQVGTPDSCYFWCNLEPEKQGGTVYVDPTEAVHGFHALRVMVPRREAAFFLDPYPLRNLETGKPLRFGIWAKTQPGKEFRFGFTPVGSRGAGEKVEFTAVDRWQKFECDFIPDSSTVRWQLEFDSPGVAWFDLMEVTPVAEGE